MPIFSASDKFDVIVPHWFRTGHADAYLARLLPGGRAVAIVGEAPVMKAIHPVYPCGRSQFRQTELFETMLTPLVNAAPVSHFEFWNPAPMFKQVSAPELAMMLTGDAPHA